MSDSIFDPNMDPNNFQPLKPKEMSGVKWEEHNRMLRDALSKMKSTKEVFVSDVERLNIEAHGKHKEIMYYAQAIADAHREGGTRLDAVQLTKEINTMYLDKFVRYSHEELLIILTTFLAQNTMREVL